MTAPKKIYGIAAIIIVAIIVVAVVLHTKRVRLQSPLILIPQSGQVVTNTSPQTVQEMDSNGSFNSLQEVSGGTATEQVSYQQALQTYKNTHIEFNPNCRVAPVTLVVPVKSVVMLDNQSKWQRSVIVGPRTYIIPPYNYVLAAFNTPGVFGISCDSVQDVGIVNVQ